MTSTNVVCCHCRTELDSEDYWFGLYKTTGRRWVSTRWYDGNTAAYRDFVRGFPLVRNSVCVSYTKDGWKDKPCDEEHYFTCKRNTGV